MRIKRLAVVSSAALAVAGALHLKKKRAASQDRSGYGSSTDSNSNSDSVTDAALSIVDEAPSYARSVTD
ncbi:MAG TPA: hypothetical protein VGJ86_01760 [Acidimicrobiales bacterium]|jgi:hypothetical protein